MICIRVGIRSSEDLLGKNLGVEGRKLLLSFSVGFLINPFGGILHAPVPLKKICCPRTGSWKS